MHRPVGKFALVLPLLALCGSLAAAAQDAPVPAPATAPAKAGPEVIAAADIPQRADVDERFAQDVVQRSRGQDPTLPLRAQLDALAGSVREESKFFKRDELRLLSIARLESLERHWKFYGKELDQWRNDLKQVMAPYNEDAAELLRRRANWEATRAAPESAGLAPALSGRIGSVLAQLGLAEQAVSGPIAQQVQLGRRANNLETGIQAGQRAVATAIDYNDSRLAKVDSPPLWTVWDDPRASGDSLKSLKAGLGVEQRFLAEYNEANADYLRKLHVLALLLLPLLLWLSYRSRKVVSDDPEIQASTRVLQRPLSSWIVLLMVGIALFEPDAPILRHQLAFLMALVPVLRLLPAAVYQVLGPWPYIATGLYLLNRLSFVLVANPFYHRIYLLAITLLTAVMVSWVLWRRRPAAGSTTVSAAQKFARTVAWAAIATLLVSAVANVIGNVSLAEMLTVAILDSGYVGLVLYAGVTVLASVMQLLLARKVLLRFNIISHHAGPLLDGFKRLLRLAAWAAWVIVVLNQFRVFRPIEELVRGTLTHELRFGQISVTLGGVLLFFFSVWLAFWIGKTVRVVLHDDVLPRMSLPRGVANSISSLTYYAVVIFGLFVALAAAGFEIGQLAIVIGALGVGIGLGLQDVVKNFVSGLILMFERPIQPGDVVEVSGTSGKVREIGMRATTLSTFEGADVVVPNGMLLSDKLINWTLSDMDRRIDVNVGVAYGSDPKQVLELLMNVTRSTPGIAVTPEPTILFAGFGTSSLDFGIRAWTNDFGDWVKIRSDLALRVHDALQAAGVVIPFPQQDVHLRSITPAAGAVLAGLGKPPEPAAGG